MVTSRFSTRCARRCFVEHSEPRFGSYESWTMNDFESVGSPSSHSWGCNSNVIAYNGRLKFSFSWAFIHSLGTGCVSLLMWHIDKLNISFAGCAVSETFNWLSISPCFVELYSFPKFEAASSCLNLSRNLSSEIGFRKRAPERHSHELLRNEKTELAHARVWSTYKFKCTYAMLQTPRRLQEPTIVAFSNSSHYLSPRESWNVPRCYYARRSPRHR